LLEVFYKTFKHFSIMPFDAGLCPTTAGVLSTVPAASCINTLDQTLRIAFQFKQATPSFISASTGAGSFALQASWTPLLSASNATKIILTPLLVGLTIPQTEVLEDTNENNIEGLPQMLGFNYSVVTAQIFDADPAVIDAIRNNVTTQSSQIAGITSIWGYLIGRNQRVSGVASGANLAGIPMYNVTISDVGSEGLRKKNIHNLRFVIPAEWSKSLKTGVAAFDPTALVNA
jgi:hypothetical protein